MTFGDFADKLVADLSPGFRNAKHRAAMGHDVDHLCAHRLRDKAIDAIGTDDVLAVLGPIWQTKPETGSRLRGRIERVLDAAKAKGLRSGENPARWRGHLDKLLPKRRSSSGASRGHALLRCSGLHGRLRQRDAVAALALEFTILTASRSGEVLGAALERDRPRAPRCGPCRLSA